MSLIISADSHVLEPGDLWSKALGKRFGDEVPHLVDNFGGDKGSFLYLGRPGEAARIDELVNASDDDERLQNLVRAGSDSAFRLSLMQQDGVAAEVLYPTWGLWVPRIPDREVRQACTTVCNDWMVDYCSADKMRLLGVGIVPMDDPAWAEKEVTRILRGGVRGVMVPTQPIDGAPAYRDRMYDPVWAALEEAQLPVTLHIVTGRVRDPFTYHGADERGEVPRSFIELFGEAAPVVANEFIFGGIFDRFPRLKITLSEYDASWIPILKYRVERIETFPGLRKLDKPAKDYIEENVYVGFINDPLVQKLRHDIGIDRLMWGSDFPHPPSPYPNTQKRIKELLGNLPEAERNLMVCDNVSRLYNIDTAQLGLKTAE